MAINKFKFSFEIDAKDLFEYISERNAGVEIQAYGTPPKVPKQLAAPKTLALPPPSAPHQPGKRKLGAMNALIIFMAMNQGKVVTRAELQHMLDERGFSHHTLNNAIWTLKNSGIVRIVKGTKGQYRVTAKGMRTAGEISNG